MAWKKVIVSGSNAELASLTLDTPLAVSSGGTGRTSLASGQVLLGNGTSAVSTVARGNISGDGKILITGGSSAVLGSGVTITAGGGLASGSVLNDIAGITPSDGTFIVGNGSTFVGESGNTVRTSLGLGSGDHPTFSGLTVTNAVTASIVSASYLIGDGSQITGLPPAAISTYTNPANNRIITSVDASTVNAEANLTFDGTTLTVTGNASISSTLTAANATVTSNLTVNGTTALNGTVNIGDSSADTLVIAGATVRMSNLPAGGDNTVLVYNSTNNRIETDEIDSRVWGSTLIDGSGAANRVAYYSDSNSITSNASFTFNGTDLTVGSSTFGTSVVIGGDLTTSGNATLGNNSTDVVVINGSTITLNNIGASSSTNNVLVWDGSKNVRYRAIDSRVWGTSLIDGTGAANRLAYFSDSNTLTTAASLTFDGTTLTVGSSTFGNDVYIAGNLTIAGSSSFQHIDNLNVADRFILLNSGSVTGDGGIIIQTETVTGVAKGAAFVYDDSADRFGLQVNTTLAYNATTATPDAYVSAVVDVDGSGHSDVAAHQKNGNIKVSGGEIYIWA